MTNQTAATISPWVATHSGRIAAGGRVLDLACGSGRHSRYLLQSGYDVFATDINLDQISELQNTAGIELMQADLEEADWPLAGMRFDGIVVCNYLHRPHLPRLANCLAPSGVLIYETFALGNEAYGKPSNPEFLLRPGELLDAFSTRLQVIAFEQGLVREPHPKVVQRICAVNNIAADTE